MKTPPKLLFDECIGYPIIEKLAALLGVTNTDVTLGHAVKMGFGGENDEDWIPRIAGEGWIIISGDRGKRPKKGTGEKLHIVCKQFGVTHAIMSASIYASNSLLKLRTIITVWDGLLALANSPRGSGHAIRRSGIGDGRVYLVCTDKPLSPQDSSRTVQRIISELEEPPP